MTKRKLIPKVRSLGELKALARNDPSYARLLCLAASNLGGGPEVAANPVAAYRWLELNAMETTERGVVGEVNFVRDLI